MSQMPLPFGVSTPPAVLQPAPPNADAARVAAYRRLCTQMQEEPAVLVLVVTAGRTDDAAQLSGDELTALARAWSASHPAPARLVSGVKLADEGATPGADRGRCAPAPGEVRAPGQERMVEARPAARASTPGRDAPQRDESGAPGRDHAHGDERRDARDQQARLFSGQATSARASEACPQDRGAPAGGPDERYVVAIAPALLLALRMRAVRDGTQMRVLVARVVTDLLDALDSGVPAPETPHQWLVPSAARTRLAMRWPAGLADRLRNAAVATGRPAHELVALAASALVEPQTAGPGR